MKRIIYLLSFVSLMIIATWYSCETDPEETCALDEICAGKSVTACCTEYECVYKYNGKEYAEDQIDQLAADLGCGSASAGTLKSESQEDDLSWVIEQLKALMDKAKKDCEACK